MTYIVNADDFHEDNNRFDLLHQIKQKLPNFKITMFTIPGLCSLQWSKWVFSDYPWIEMVPHGWKHPHPRECESWTFNETMIYLDLISKIPYYVHGFKAPGWQISGGTYKALDATGYWVADQEYNDWRRPFGLKSYVLTHDDPDVKKMHFHVQNVCGNGLEESLDQIMSLDPDEEFMFVSEYIKVKYDNSNNS